MLIYTAEERISARAALKHPYFKDLVREEKPLRICLSPVNKKEK